MSTCGIEVSIKSLGGWKSEHKNESDVSGELSLPGMVSGFERRHPSESDVAGNSLCNSACFSYRSIISPKYESGVFGRSSTSGDSTAVLEERFSFLAQTDA